MLELDQTIHARHASARAIWIATVVGWTAIFVLSTGLSMSGFVPLLDQARAGIVHGEGLFSISPEIARTLAGAGISEVVLAQLAFMARLGGWLVFGLTGLVIFLLKPKDRAAFVVSVMLITVGTAILAPLGLVTATQPELLSAVALIGQASEPWAHFGRSLAGVSALLAMLILPDGRFVPHWTRWLAASVMAMVILWVALPGSFVDVAAWPSTMQLLWVAGVPLAGVTAQMYRYVRVSTADERRQTRAVIAAVAVAAAAFVALVVLDPQLGTGAFDLGVVTPETVAFYEIILLVLLGAAVLFLPISIAWSVLRYRLFDVHFLINRALVYTALTALMALVGLSAVFVLSRTLGLLLGEVIATDVALVGSTVAITLLFGPARRWVQGLINRAFYRRRYDVARTLEDFGQRMLLGSSLEGCATELLTVVDETMQPRSVFVWLRSADQPSPRRKISDKEGR